MCFLNYNKFHPRFVAQFYAAILWQLFFCYSNCPLTWIIDKDQKQFLPVAVGLVRNGGSPVSFKLSMVSLRLSSQATKLIPKVCALSLETWHVGLAHLQIWHARLKNTQKFGQYNWNILSSEVQCRIMFPQNPHNLNVISSTNYLILYFSKETKKNKKGYGKSKPVGQ